MVEGEARIVMTGADDRDAIPKGKKVSSQRPISRDRLLLLKSRMTIRFPMMRSPVHLDFNLNPLHP